MATLEDAIALAVKTHRGQKDKAGEPYILHPLRVMFRLPWDAPDAVKIAAVLHDVVEDSDGKVTLEDLQRLGYAQEVVEAVELLSRRSSDTYEQFIERLLPNHIARLVKRADLEDNMDVRRMPTVGDRERERLARYRAAWALVVHAEQKLSAQSTILVCIYGAR